MSAKVSNITERLAEAMRLRGKSQADLAQETGLTKGAVSSYLSGRYEPKSTTLSGIAKVLNVSDLWLAGYDVSPIRTERQDSLDKAVDVLLLLKDRPELVELVEQLAQLPEDKLSAVRAVLAAMGA